MNRVNLIVWGERERVRAASQQDFARAWMPGLGSMRAVGRRLSSKARRG